jgi:iron complex outermembrane recepter protein
LLSAYADWHFDLGNREALVFLRGTNLLDEEIREHPSFLKEVAPGAGRAWELGVRFNF